VIGAVLAGFGYKALVLDTHEREGVAPIETLD